MSEEKSYALLPLRDIVVFPNMVVPLYVGRELSVRALSSVVNGSKELVLCAQVDENIDDPVEEEIHAVGVIANVLQFLKIPGGTIKVLVEGTQRVRIDGWVENDSFLEVKVEELQETFEDTKRSRAYFKAVKKIFLKYASAKKALTKELESDVESETDQGRLADMVAGTIVTSVSVKQKILAMDDVTERLSAVLDLLQTELQIIDLEKNVKKRVKTQLEKNQREHILTEQMKAIQRELGDKEELSELDELEQRIGDTKFSEEARSKALSELKKVRSMSPNSPEVQVSRNYLDWLLDIPWGVKQDIQSDIKLAEKILDDDHFGLRRVKERIVEFIAVQQRTGSVGGTILCLVGPPGVGKTSLGQSVARATGREFVRIALGGIHDESEIRGHRRTYVGAMPGRIIKSFRKGKSINPLILLDEIDKVAGGRGDPASALLEVLDPEQNSKFYDNYLDVDYDLSEVMFITTANYLHDIPTPLRDRMEIVQLDGYTEYEKLEIAKRHLMPELLERTGIKKKEFRLPDEVIQDIIRTHTQEAGVRNLKREIARLMRKAVTKIVKGEAKRVQLTSKNLESYLGMARYHYGSAEKTDQVGVATGLAWTQAGGDLLSIEASAIPGKGRMRTTGTLGDVMKESISAASTFVRSIASEIGVTAETFERTDIHVHVPEGATPKEGPSAGVGMVTAIVSVLTGIKVRKEVAMTGEVTLRGTVLRIGGLKAKLLAAIRGGIELVLIPKDNVRDLAEIPDAIKNQIEIRPIRNVSEVLEVALVRRPTPLIEDDVVEGDVIAPTAVLGQEEPPSVAKH
ncbi:MAG: endopeptidase La [Rhodobacteraceae bacterium]|nr:endopeptidase La [Paracoccaceae bacterium]